MQTFSFETDFLNWEETFSSSSHLVDVAQPLVVLIISARQSLPLSDVPQFRQQVIDEIKRFEKALSSLNYSAETLKTARYCLCAALDEAVLSQSWGAKSIWRQGSLVNFFEKETWGGERFYDILERALNDASRQIELLELIYLLISLGFEGKFFGEENRSAREEIRQKIFYCLKVAGKTEKQILSPHSKAVPLEEPEKREKKRLKIFFIASVMLVLTIGLFYQFTSYEVVKPFLSQINLISS